MLSMPRRPSLTMVTPLKAMAYLAATATLLAGCADTAPEAGPDAGTVATASSGVETSAGAEWSGPDAVAERCRSRAPEGVDVVPVRVEDGPVSVDGASITPEAPRLAVVMLPQTDGGLCGGLGLAAALAAEGIAVLSLDACGYDESTCEESASARDQVDAGISHLREALGADVAVVGVGASMGGHLVTNAAASGSDLVRWVDLSGPVAWDGEDLTDMAGQLSTPGLVVHAPSDDPSAFTASRRLARQTGARFIRAAGGHGWEMVSTWDGGTSRLGRDVIAFVSDAKP